MDKIILVDKDKNYTSRDVVNILSSKLKTKKIGHFGTLDPLATGLLVIGVGKYTKLEKLFATNDKEYIAEVLIGVKTDTYDISGNVLDTTKDYILDKEKIKEVLKSFKGKYLQEVPIYSAVKVNGKKLYQYARNKESVVLPKKEVEISEIELLEFKNIDGQDYFTFRVVVSKGTYIRSLINDMANKLNINLCMSNLRRIRQDNILVSSADKLSAIKNGDITFYDIDDFFKFKTIDITSDIEKLIINGNKIKGNEELVLYTKDNKKIALYQKDKDDYMKPVIMY